MRDVVKMLLKMIAYKSLVFRSMLFIALFISALSFIAQSELRYEDYVYQPEIKTPLCYLQGDLLSAPFIELNAGRIEVRFDDFSSEIKDYYYYTIVHCDYWWNPSDLDKSDYMTGFFENSITNSEGSFNTYQEYVHYIIEFPNDMSGISKSGNYLMIVYEDNDESNLVLTRRFVAYEQLVNVSAWVKDATAIADSRYKQEVDVQINFSNYSIDNPYEDFHIAIMQNDRWDNAITELQPRFVKSNELDYDYSDINVFDGGNEFREFNLTNVNFVTSQVRRVDLIEGQWQAWLRPDPRRAITTYVSNRDINGAFYIVNKEGFEQHIEEDYILVNFILSADKLFYEDVFVAGKFSGYLYDEQYKMTYDEEHKAYWLALYLKQGYYNYLYLAKSADELHGDVSKFEGNHHETENKYTVIAYNKDFIAGYDRVVGMLMTDSFNR